MNSKLTNLVSLSKNKFNINLLETIEHKELFQNLNKKINQNKINNIYEVNNSNKGIEDNENEYYIINDDDNSNNKENNLNNQNKNEITYLKYDSFIFKNDNSKNNLNNNMKISSKSLKNVVKNKSENYKEVFTKLSPKKNNIRCITQDNEHKNYEINNIKNQKSKNDINDINNININTFNFERNCNNIQNKQHDNSYFTDYSNKENNKNICYFKGGKKRIKFI